MLVSKSIGASLRTAIPGSIRWFSKSTPHSSQSIAFIGLGQMGRAMAQNLASKSFLKDKDTHFVVCDAMPGASDRFCLDFGLIHSGANITAVSSAAEAVQRASTVITMLPSSPEVKSVYQGPGGILEGLKSLKEGSEQRLLIDSTTLDVEVAREVAAQVHSVSGQISMVDAPVSGGTAGAKAGTLAFLVGGSSDAFALAVPLLSFMGSPERIIHCGPSGAGLIAKICNNMILGIQQIAVAEGMNLGTTLGLDPAILASVINSSTGGCWASKVNNPVRGALPGTTPPCENEYQGGFASALMLKDIRLATAIGFKQLASENLIPLTVHSEKLYNEMIKTNPEFARKDFSSIYEWLRIREQT